MTAGCGAPASSPAHSASPSSPTPGLRVVARMRLPGGNSRFDYASLDSRRGLLFVAHLGASQLVEINIAPARWCAPSAACPRSMACWCPRVAPRLRDRDGEQHPRGRQDVEPNSAAAL